jgi:hypothetical protein
MKRFLVARVDRLLGEGVGARLKTPERDAVTEVCFLAMAVDGILAAEERKVFTQVVRLLHGTKVSSRSIRKIIRRLRHKLEWMNNERCLQTLALDLAEPFVRELAYKLAMLMTLCDFETNAPETDFNHRLRHVLGLDKNQISRLTDEVCCAFGTCLDS